MNNRKTFYHPWPAAGNLGEVETKLPAPAKKRGMASVVLVALALVSVLGIGGAKLKGVYNETAKLQSAMTNYNNSIRPILAGAAGRGG